ncbi:hypothetical protein E2C01_003228 [Portunus trituberculatus]|uniref:Uncharacterized protein n=1 Tax=Portunus trituberculatus TaxID=210409 RepID=A0A5B7CMD2_PORTR|nr:hypothetical protein [Portunus trituberculatus]
MLIKPTTTGDIPPSEGQGSLRNTQSPWRQVPGLLKYFDTSSGVGVFLLKIDSFGSLPDFIYLTIHKIFIWLFTRFIGELPNHLYTVAGYTFPFFVTHAEDIEPEEAVESAESVDVDRPRRACPEPRAEGGTSSS